MAIFKCKMCGGDLEISEGASIVECEYCGTKQTLPKAIDENLQTLFNRATTLRRKGEFDKAEKIYEKIVKFCMNFCHDFAFFTNSFLYMYTYKKSLFFMFKCDKI